MSDPDELAATLTRIGLAEDGPMFMGKPDRWYEEGPAWRCINDHVSSGYLRCEEPPYARCLACMESVLLTFPEDRDGPLICPTCDGTGDDPQTVGQTTGTTFCPTCHGEP